MSENKYDGVDIWGDDTERRALNQKNAKELSADIINSILTENAPAEEEQTGIAAAELAEPLLAAPVAATAAAQAAAAEPTGWWGRHFGFMSASARAWFYLVLALMVCGGFYLGFWGACQQTVPIDVPYVTSDNYFANKEAAQAAMKDYLGDDNILTVLLLGCDMREGESVGRADTIMLAFVNLEKGAVNLLSIPRDTRVALAEGKGTTKINHAFAYGGQPLIRKTIESFLDVEIDRYVQVDFEGFAGVIDALGGVDYNVEQRMYKPSESIDLQPGQQRLDGHQALAYVRWRGTATADIGRVERQQKFLNAALDQVMSSGTIFKLPQLLNKINQAVNTDFTLNELMALIEIYKEFPTISFASDKLPGEGAYINGISYWTYYPNQTAELVAKMRDFNLPDNDEPAAGDGAANADGGAA